MKKIHKENCRYKNTDKLLYAYMDMGVENGKLLISANELELFDTYLEKAMSKDETVNIDYDESDKEPFQIMYGALMFNSEKQNLKEVTDLAMKMKNSAMISLEENKVSVSGYLDIALYSSNALSENFIPFAALMQTPYKLDNMDYSITIFPALKDYYVWESMANRPFLLACRKSVFIDDLSAENWRKHVIIKDMLEAYKVSDLYTENGEVECDSKDTDENECGCCQREDRVENAKLGDKNGFCFGVPGIGRAIHPWDDLKKCSCGGYPNMVGLDGKDFCSGSPYKIFCTMCLKSTVTNEDISIIKKEWNEHLN